MGGLNYKKYLIDFISVKVHKCFEIFEYVSFCPWNLFIWSQDTPDIYYHTSSMLLPLKKSHNQIGNSDKHDVLNECYPWDQKKKVLGQSETNTKNLKGICEPYPDFISI